MSDFDVKKLKNIRKFIAEERDKYERGLSYYRIPGTGIIRTEYPPSGRLYSRGSDLDRIMTRRVYHNPKIK